MSNVRKNNGRLLAAAVVFAFSQPVAAQLTDATQSFPFIPGGQIAKSLQEQVGAGHGDELTPDSSVFIIKRDPARSVRRGRQIFQRKFTFDQGVGPRVSEFGDIAANPGIGAGLSDSCASCHGRPRGSAGFGGDVATRPDSRDSPHLFGLGLQEMLADEITQELRGIRAQASELAQDRNRPVRKNLFSKGVYYGRITAFPDGSFDNSRIEGVDEDLRVRPFFAQGGTFSMREFIVGAFQDEMGLQAHDPLLATAASGGRVVTPAGLVLDGSLDTFNAPPVQSPTEDADGDGVANEIDTAIVDHMEFYLLNYFKPGLDRQTRDTRRGRFLMDRLGCTSCHIADFTVDNDRRAADVTTVYDPVNGVFNRLFATITPLFVEVDDDSGFTPLRLPAGNSFRVENIFTDFKRHDLGPTFWERNYDGSFQKEIITEPLWGVGTTPPYGHDGRSLTLRNVILRHGGEAAASSRAFATISPRLQDDVIAFLNSLILFPPDDTASNTNPADPNAPNFPQNGHGSINLGAVFVDPSDPE